MIGLVQYGPWDDEKKVYNDHAYFSELMDEQELGKILEYYYFSRVMSFIEAKELAAEEEDEED